jgi:hypothetical protein
MIYVFKTPFVNSKGRIIPSGDRVFIDNIDSDDEVAREVKKRIEAEKERKKRKKVKDDGDVQ